MPRSLSKGNTGLDVSELQAALNFHIRAPREPLQPDGIFGPKTDACARHFQKLAKITADGIVGPVTLKHLYRSTSGVVGANVLRSRARPSPADARFRLLPVMGFKPMQFGPARPIVPDKPGPLQLRMPQARAAQSVGFQFESKLVFNPLADGKSDHRLQFTITPDIPWPIFLPDPLNLEVETGLDSQGRPKLDGKIKVPFKIKIPQLKFLEFKPYFFFGGGVEARHFTDLNAGAGSSLRLKFVEPRGPSGMGVSVEADGGVMFNYDLDGGEGKLKGFFNAGVVLSF